MAKDVRDTEQEAVVDLYLELDPLRATAVLSTGFGKSKVAIDILKAKRPAKIVILVNSTILRDESWKAEFAKFGEAKMYEENVETHTYQMAYKWSPDDVNLDDVFVICDEIDFAADTDALSSFFYTYPNAKMLGLTGFITDEKKEWFRNYMPIITQLTANDAQNKGLLNKVHYVFVRYDLSEVRNITVSYKKHGVQKTFKQSENAAYDYANKQCHILQGDLSKLDKALNDGEIDMSTYIQKTKNKEYLLNRANAKRADILLGSSATVTLARKLIQYAHGKNPESKVVVFTMRTDQADAICEDHVYHGNIHKKTAQANFEAFQRGEIKILGVCGKIDRGANIPGLDTGVMADFYGSDTKFTQRVGRLLRLKPSDVATMYVLLPYYMRKERDKSYTVQETQQVKWALSMLRSTIIHTSEVWDYRTVKSND